MSELLRFPENFLWGSATSSYQIEGAAGLRPSCTWDAFPAATGETGAVACDHYHRWREDLDLMQQVGLQAYRFSISWPRVLGGDIDFYSRLVDGMLERGITPFCTLYHWDLPSQFSWLDRSTVERFGEYAAQVAATLGDRVKLWVTHNEPWCSAFLGFFRGVHAPGVKDFRKALQAAHNIILSHGVAAAQLPGQAGITLSLFPTYAMRPEDAEAARLSDGYTNRWFLDPVLRGHYPADTAAHFEWEETLPGNTRCDFLGVNYYHRRVIESTPGEDLGWKVHDRTGAPVTDLGWEIVPQCMTELLTRLQLDYGKPLYITENGAVFNDVLENARVHDARRIDFLQQHFAAAHRAIAQGVDLRGYFVWTFLDNFEWAFGTKPRFGLTHVDYATQQRTLKDSARWYADVIKRNGLDACAAGRS
jgi:beta-glucosidase